MAKTISKVSVRCPHCGGEQLEPELAKSTFCRSCSEYFAIGPATLASAKPAAHPARPEVKPKYGLPTAQREHPATESAPLAPSQKSAVETPGPGLFQKFETLFGKPRTREAQCFECSATHEISGNAHSTTCRACGAYIDLQDYKINSSFSRNVKTRGSLYLGSKGDLSSSKIICTDAIIHGKMRGNMQCLGRVEVKYEGRLQGSLEAGSLIIEKGCDIVFSRPVKAASVTIAGKMSGQIFSSSHITVLKHGSLDGAAVATGFSVERGGCFQGELTICPPGTSAEELRGGESEENSAEMRPHKSTDELGAFLAGEQHPA